VEGPPTPDQLKTILSYTNHSTGSVFLSAHPSASGSSNTLSAISDLAAKNPKAFKWPVVVDWEGGKASIGDVEGVKNILEHLRKLRDGEVENQGVDKPKGWFS
jgi:hypothetical protein